MGEVERSVNQGVVRGVGYLRGLVQRYPLLSVAGGAAVSYYGSQYGPMVAGAIRLLAPMVGMKCE